MAPLIQLPDSPSLDPQQTQGLLSPWQAPRNSWPSDRSPPFSQSSFAQRRDSVINTAEKSYRRFMQVWNRLSFLQKCLAVVGIIILDTFFILFLVFNEKIFSFLEPLAEKWKNTTGGWIVLWIITFITAFPPMIGYSTCGTTAGFVYGAWEGWLILATATVAGSTCSFIVSRTVLRSYVERMIANDTRFNAFALTLKQDGLKLLCMIRLCPLPYSLSNGAMSTVPTVHPAMYALATTIITPKLLIHTFIGSRLAVIARSGGEMSTGAKIVNYTSIAFGACLGMGVGYYIYQKTMARARELEQEEAANAQDPVRRPGPPPKQFSDDPEAQHAVDVVLEQDTMDYFDETSTSNERGAYTDDYTDDDDPFGRGDGPDEDTAGSHRTR
ncbi:Golgi apparatus membrane protein tvp38 [Cyphellophora attinorum]|uniref:Golgi apparatus membrane protein TVP38 n=1 Tax=Cyphellophora attinorum TaxID=1664694 RepID=A0A0N0NQ50_9EURO|nr:Golgi apparatus membrane protein tvp38 [Phialophora attinorum]KPI43498.1 Golgi apparatus membrane protein tvp38 [Phialophora attinorum]